MLPEEPPTLWFPMPPRWQPEGHERPLSTNQPPLSPSDWVGNPAINEGRSSLVGEGARGSNPFADVREHVAKDVKKGSMS